ncbi:cytochrome P450 2U1-like isoform X2 [Leptotrombidium deliense]|uniref:Cytochrome P450 2U1-like isoform X2 n=1 Tax=Leptotrombidium deliense TaxID=299467 RepID=A0A443S173_9ACAR|nr:cytochrome P450 2U1-like isoform X2 [Leptotrombidium deliense]
MSGPLVQIYVNLKHNFLRGFKQCKKEYFDEIQKIIDERLQTFDESNCRCMLDYYLKEQKGVNGKHFDMDTLKGMVLQLFFGGTLTTAFDLYNMLQQMALNSSIQEKVYKEIEDVIGDGSVMYSDIMRMPYTHAVISETQRFSSSVSFTSLHVSTGVPYSVGCRRCPGAKLADVTIFIGFVTLLQEFEWKIPQNSSEFGMLSSVPRSK